MQKTFKICIYQLCLWLSQFSVFTFRHVLRLNSRNTYTQTCEVSVVSWTSFILAEEPFKCNLYVGCNQASNFINTFSVIEDGKIVYYVSEIKLFKL